MAAPVAVVADSTCCLTPEEVASAGVALVDLDVVIDGQARPESELTTAVIAEAMRRRRQIGTSSPPPSRFTGAFQAAVEAGAAEIVCVHLAARASGTANVARMTAAQVRVPVQIVDSGQLGRATGAVVLAAARAAAAGAAAPAVVDAAQRAAAGCRTVFCVDDLGHLRRGGRLSVTQTLIGTALSVKPLLVVRGGLVEVLERVRTAARARARLLTLARDGAGQADGPVRLFVQHVDAPEAAQDLMRQLRQQVSVPVDLVEVSPVISAHVGPGALGFVVSSLTS